MACSTPSFSNVEGILDQKWSSSQDLATQSVTAARAALDAITGSASTGISAAGLNLDLPSTEAGQAQIQYNEPPQPALPDLSYASLNPGTVQTYGLGGSGGPGYRDPGLPPTLSVSVPGAISGISFTAPPVLNDFTETFQSPNVPAYSAPAEPNAFSEAYTISPIQLPLQSTAPADFTEAPPAPTTKIVPALTATPPSDPAEVTLPAYPSAPSLNLPSLPNDLGIPLPTLRVPDLSGIDGLLDEILQGQPAEPSLAIPTDSYLDTFSTLKTQLGPELEPVLPIEETLTWMLAGDSIGIPASVAQALRDRAFGAEDRQAFQAEAEVINDWVSRGFTLPGGALESKLAMVRQLNRDKKAEINRDLWIEEAKLEIENLRFAVTSGIQYQSSLWDAKTKLWGVCSELANRFMDVQLKVLDATVGVFKAKLDSWQTRANVYRDYINALLQAELSKLEVTKAETEVSKLFVSMNGQQVELYKAKLEGVLSQVNVYRAQVEAANGQLQAETLKLEAFAKKVQAYQASVQAYEAEWRGYSAAVQADTALMDGFKSQVQAYQARVDAYGKTIEANRTATDVQIEVGRFGLEAYKTRADVHRSNVEVFAKSVDAERTRIAAEVDVAKLSLDAYTTQAQAYSARADAYGKRVQAESTRVQSQIEISKLPVELYNAQVRAFAAQMDGYRSKVEAAKTETMAEVEIERLKMESFRNELDAYRAELQRAATEIDAKAKVHGSQVQLFGMMVDSEKTRVTAELQNIDQQLRQSEFAANITLKNAELQQTKVLELAKIALQGESEVARVAAQLAGAALSAVNAGVSISNDYRASNDKSCSEIYNYEG